jgi:thiol-disulfide isomerase/thioredoxin
VYLIAVSMKKLALLFSMLFCCILNAANAQTTNPPAVKYTPPGPESVVKDSSGTVYPYETWMKMVRSREYGLKSVSSKPGFTLYKLTAQQKAKLNAEFPIIASPKLAQRQSFTPPGETSIVKDTSGMVYPYAVWSKLFATGNYNLMQKYVRPDSGTYFLIKKSQQQKDAIMARIPKPEESKQFISGKDFNPFKERDMKGEKLDLKKMPGKVIVLNFWFIGCPPCRAEIPELSEMADKYKNNPDVLFIAVALDQSYDLKDFLKDHPLNYHVIDNGRYLADRYGVHLYPTNVVIDRDSKVAYSSEGGHMNNIYWMEKTINAALASPQKTTAAQ